MSRHSDSDPAYSVVVPERVTIVTKLRPRLDRIATITPSESEYETMGNKRGVSAELILPVQKVVEYLRRLADSMEQGRVYVEHGAEMIGLSPTGLVEVEIEAKQKKDREKLVIELSWHAAEEKSDASQGLKITTGPEE